MAVGWLSQGFWIYLILQDKTLFCAFEAGDIVCWLVNPPIAKLDLFKSADCRWMCKTYAEFSATVRRFVQSPTLQTTIFCGCPSDLRGKGIRVSTAREWTATKWSFVTDKKNCEGKEIGLEMPAFRPESVTKKLPNSETPMRSTARF